MTSETKAVLAEQARQLIQPALISNLVHIAVVGAIYAMFRDTVDVNLLTLWWITSTLFACSRLLVWYRYKKHIGSGNEQRELTSYTYLSALLGFTWAGFSLFYMATADSELKSVIVILSCGVMAAAVPVLSAWSRAFYAFTLPQFISLLSVLFLSGNCPVL